LPQCLKKPNCMKYKYNTPEEAIISLETAYTAKDLEAVIASKDFGAEAKIILESKSYEITDDLIIEVAKLLELSLTKSLSDNGYPNFKAARREFSKLDKLKDNIYFIEERIFYPDNTCHINEIFLSNKDGLWKVAMVKE